MILRRVIEHVKAQNWTAVALDFVIVVMGVFIGIQVANWNEGRAGLAEEAKMLLALKEDLAVTLPEIDRQLGWIIEDQEARAKLAAYVEDKGAELSVEELDQLMYNSFWRFGNRHPALPTLEELKASGRLNRLGNAALRRKILELDNGLGAYNTDYMNVFETVYSFTDPFLIKNYDMRGLFRRYPGRDEQPAMDLFDPDANRSDLAALRTREFENLLVYRTALVQDIYKSLDAIKGKYAEIAVEIDIRLAELGHKTTPVEENH